MSLLQVKNLNVSFPAAHAVSGVSFEIERGEVFGLVGGSGSGKTLTALSIVKLTPPSSVMKADAILFNGVDLAKKDERYLRAVRGSRISFVFQEPSSAFNPVFTIGEQIAEAALAHNKERLGVDAARELAIEYMSKVHIKDPAKVFDDYPHQLSGGTKQRAGIAMALVNSPELLVLDEPTTALDVTIQSGILDLLDEVIEKENVSALFISHDFGIIARMCDKVAVMKQGGIVERGSAKEIFNNPKDPYTQSLLDSVRALS